jgi:hypothetical protein
MTISLGTTIRPVDDVVAREIGGETVLLNLSSGIYFGLNAVGARVWQLLQPNGASLASLCAAICDEYAVSLDEAAQDIQALAADLVEHGLIELLA